MTVDLLLSVVVEKARRRSGLNGSIASAALQTTRAGLGGGEGVVVRAFTHCLERVLIGSDRPKLSLTLKNAAGALDEDQR